MLGHSQCGDQVESLCKHRTVTYKFYFHSTGPVEMILYNIALADGLMCGAAITHYAVRNLFPPNWDSSSNWKISVPLSKCKHQILRNHDMMWVSGVSFSVNITMVIKNPAKYKDVLQTGTTYNKVIYMYVIIKHNFGTFYNKVVYMYFIVKHNSYEARNTTTGPWPCRCPSTGQDGSIELEMVQELYYSVHNNLGSRCDFLQRPRGPMTMPLHIYGPKMVP